MTILDLGYKEYFDALELQIESQFLPARVIRANKRYYKLFSDDGTYLARITGAMRHHSEIQSELPVVGDWVLMKPSNDSNTFIERVLPRKNVLYRKSSTKKTDIQALVSNIDFAFIIVGLDNEMAISKIGRYLSMVHTANIKPVIVISKMDLYKSSIYKGSLKRISEAFENEEIFVCSAISGKNCSRFSKYIVKGTTSVFIGASGAGKSTLINRMLKEQLIKTQEVRDYDSKGMHTTTHRELFILKSGGVVIDTPGLRSLGVWEDDKGIKKTFKDIEEYAQNCRFHNCTHQHEPGCYILEMIDAETLSYERYSAYITLKNESKDVSKKNVSEMKKEQKEAYRKITRKTRYAKQTVRDKFFKGKK